MGELEEKLENILGNPQAMAQIMSLAQSLNLGGPPAAAPGPEAASDQAQPQGQSQGAEQSSNPPPPPQGGDAPAALPPAPPPAAPAASGGGLGGMLGALGSLDPGTLSAAANLIGQFNNGGDDQRTALLNALRPFVKEQRYAKLDKAIQIAKLSRLIRSGLELFRQRKEDGHV